MKREKLYITVATILFASGISVGGFCLVRTSPEILYEYFTGHRGGLLGPMAGTAALNAVFVWTVLFFSAFFRFGKLTAMLTVFIKGFTNGYAITAAFKIYAKYGLFISLQDIFYVPLIIYLASIACNELSDTTPKTGFTRKALIILLLMGLSSVFGSCVTCLAGKYILPTLEI